MTIVKSLSKTTIAIILFGLFLACEDSQKKTASNGVTPESIKVGILIDSTAYSGESNRWAVTLAAQELAGRGGLTINGKKHRVVFVVKDNQGKPDIAVTNVRKLIYQDQVVAIIGPSLSRTAIPVANVADGAKTIMITQGSTHPNTTKGKSYVFRMAYQDPAQGKLVAAYLQSTNHYKKFAVFFDEANPSSNSVATYFAQSLNKAKVDTVLMLPYTNTQSSIRAEEKSDIVQHRMQKIWQQYANQIIAKDIEVVFLPNVSNDALEQAKILRSNGFHGVLAGSDNWAPRIVENSPDLNGAIFSHHWNKLVVSDQKKLQLFITKYSRLAGREPEDFSAITYDAIHLLADAIEKVGLQSDAIRLHLKSGVEFQGVSGSYLFANDGNSNRKPYLFAIRSQHIESLSEIDDTERQTVAQ